MNKFLTQEELDAYNLRHTYCTMLNNCGIGEYFKKRLKFYSELLLQMIYL